MSDPFFSAASRLACLSVLWLALLGVEHAAAQATASDKAAAEMLYDRGISLMRDGKVAEACSQFEQSQAIDRGIGTMLHLAECYEQLGRTASAWALFREAASAARFEGQTDRVKWGTERAAALAPKLSMLTLQVAPENQVQGFVLSRDDAAVAQGLWNVPVPVDPGVHKLHAEAPGYYEWSAEVTVGPDADSVTLRVPALSRKPEEAAPPEAVAAVAGAGAEGKSTAAHGAPHEAGGWPVQRTVGLVVGGAGVVALAVGGVFGLKAISKKGDMDDCVQPSCPVATDTKLFNDGNDAAKLANVFVIGGGVLAATGLVLYLTSGSAESEDHAALGFDFDRTGARVTLGGAF